MKADIQRLFVECFKTTAAAFYLEMTTVVVQFVICSRREEKI